MGACEPQGEALCFFHITEKVAGLALQLNGMHSTRAISMRERLRRISLQRDFRFFFHPMMQFTVGETGING